MSENKWPILDNRTDQLLKQSHSLTYFLDLLPLLSPVL